MKLPPPPLPLPPPLPPALPPPAPPPPPHPPPPHFAERGREPQHILTTTTSQLRFWAFSVEQSIPSGDVTAWNMPKPRLKRCLQYWWLEVVDVYNWHPELNAIQCNLPKWFQAAGTCTASFCRHWNGASAWQDPIG